MTNYDETDDYSFNGAHNTYRLWDKVTVYCDGNLIWGIEPGTENFSQENCTSSTMAVLGSTGEDYMTPTTYQAIACIAADGIVESGTSVTFKAGTSITLSEGFYAEGGSGFSAIIEDCPTYLQAPSTTGNEGSQPVKVSVEASLVIAPNPLSDQTNLYFNLPEPCKISLAVTNSFGQLIDTPMNQIQYDQGAHEYTLNTTNYLAGIYFVHLRSGNNCLTKKILVVK